jgi:hypothetical protein
MLYSTLDETIAFKNFVHVKGFDLIFYIIKEFVQPKMSLNREFLIWKEQERG